MRTLQFRELSTFCRMIGEFVVGKGRAGHNIGSHDEDSAQKRGAQSAQNCFAITNGVGLKRPLAKVSRPKFAPREHSGQRPPEIRARRSRLLKQQGRASQRIREKRWRLSRGHRRLSASWSQRIYRQETAKHHRRGLRWGRGSTLKYRSYSLTVAFKGLPQAGL